jgi:starch phosphorylase
MAHPLDRPLPDGLAGLTDLALDLRWTGSPFADSIWERLDPETWQRTNNPYLVLLNCPQERLDAADRDEKFRAELKFWLDGLRRYEQRQAWFHRSHAGSALCGVAYFSMEFGLSESLPIYSGGLGILAGDHLKSASDLGVPLVGIGLLYQQGYFRQVLAPDGSQLEAFPYNDPSLLPVTPARDADGRWLRVPVALPGRELYLRVWKARVGRITLYLLDGNDPLNSPWDRGITATLYAAGRESRLLQELVLGVGGWALLERLGMTPEVCHLNEGHAAFVVVARAASFARASGVPFPVALRATRAGNVFTTHTPLEAAFDKFEPNMLVSYCGPLIGSTGLTPDRFLALGRENPRNAAEPFNMAYLAVRGCGRVNGVSRLHARVSRQLFGRLFPARPVEEVPISAITNGVHVPTWDSPAAATLWGSATLGGSWHDQLGVAAQALRSVDAGAIWDARAKSRRALVEYVRQRLLHQLRQRGAPPDEVEEAVRALDPNALTLGFARRFAVYKRPTLLILDLDRLARLLNHPTRPVQLLVAGKAHPNDEHGKSLVRALVQASRRPELRGRLVFLEDYEMLVARRLAAGVDVWINLPARPMEACGTSGMKVLVNGGLNLSVLDGWWDEGYAADVGWQVGNGREDSGPGRDYDEGRAVLELLEEQVIPEFYTRDAEGIPRAWVARVRASMTKLTPLFNSDRMVRDYTEGAYLPAATEYRRRAADGGAVARALEEWHTHVHASWHAVRFGEVRYRTDQERTHFEVQVYLGELKPDAVSLQLFAAAVPDHPAERVPMTLRGPIRGATAGYVYVAELPAGRPPGDYTPRIQPVLPEGLLALEDGYIFWQR